MKTQYREYTFRRAPSRDLASVLEENQDALKRLGVLVMYVDTSKGSRMVGFCLKHENVSGRLVTFESRTEVIEEGLK